MLGIYCDGAEQTFESTAFSVIMERRRGHCLSSLKFQYLLRSTESRGASIFIFLT